MVYDMLLEQNVCAEQARMVLPQNTMTEWIWSGTLFAFAKMCKLRLDAHTQRETQEIAKMIDKYAQVLYPVSWKALMEYGE
jgi:thymidylate synthase (FAD)